jgi:hypothetical protein
MTEPSRFSDPALAPWAEGETVWHDTLPQPARPLDSSGVQSGSSDEREQLRRDLIDGMKKDRALRRGRHGWTFVAWRAGLALAFAALTTFAGPLVGGLALFAWFTLEARLIDFLQDLFLGDD